jgi:hypothetical protein
MEKTKDNISQQREVSKPSSKSTFMKINSLRMQGQTALQCRGKQDYSGVEVKQK